MSNFTTEILIVIALIFLNGLFTMAEMAIVSARKSRLQQKAEAGNEGAAKALRLAENPNRFLSTVQIGITTIGILTGAFGGATIADRIVLWMNQVSWLAPYSQILAVALVVIVITYLSLVLGELVPKRLGMNSAERVATRVAPFVQGLSVFATPVVNLLSASTELVLKLLRVRPSQEPLITQEDVRIMLDQGTEVGVFEAVEQDMVERIFRLDDRNVSAIITPRTDVVFLDIDSPQDDILRKIIRHPFSHFPIIQGSPDNVLGIVQTRDLLLQRIENNSLDIHKALRQPLYIPEASSALDALERFKKEGADVAIVIDEFGGVVGIVNMDDILEAIVGEVSSPEQPEEAEAIQREDGSWLFDGMIAIDELKDLLEIDVLPDEEDGDYETLGGMVMAVLGRIPVSGDHFEWDRYRFEVVDMDRRRVDKVLVCPKEAS